MSKVVILGGAGQVGEAALRDLIETSDVREIVIADVDLKAAQRLVDKVKCGYVSAKKGDIFDRQETVRLLKGADVVINCTPFMFSHHVIKLALEAKAHYIDFNGDFIKQKELHDEFQKNDLTAVTNMGECPGIIDLMAMYAVDKLDSVENIEAISVGKDFTKGMPPYYFTWSPEGQIISMGAPAVVWKRRKGKAERRLPAPKSLFDAFEADFEWEDGEIIHVSTREKKIVQFPEPIGETEVSQVIHIEQATFPMYFKDKGLQNVSFWENIDWKTVFLYEMGFGSDQPLNVKGAKVAPIDFIAALIRKNNMVGYPETVTPDYYDADKIIATGKKDGKDTTIIMDAIFPSNKKWKTSGQANPVGISGSITAQMILKGKIKKRGVFVTGETGIKPEPFFNELAKRNVKFYMASKEQIAFT